MKILIYGLNFSPEIVGIGKFTGELASFLAEEKNEVKVVCSVPYYPSWQTDLNSYSVEKIKNLSIYRCPIWLPKRKSGLRRLIHHLSFAFSSLPLVIRNIIWGPDIIFTIAPSILSAPITIILSKFSFINTKLWLHIQDFEIDIAFQMEMLKGKFLRYILNYFEKLIYNQFDILSTISNSMAIKLKDKTFKKKVFIIPNWIDTKKIFPKKKNQENFFRSALKIKKNNLVLLYSGTISEKQGIEIILKAYDKLINLRNLIWIIAGEGPTRKKVQKEIRNKKNFFYLPLQPEDRINDLLNLADIHLIPQKIAAENLVMPSKLFGILASGKSFVSTCSKNSELGIITNKCGLRANPENLEDFINAIKFLLKNPEKRVDLGKVGRELVVKDYEKFKILSRIQKEMKKIII